MWASYTSTDCTHTNAMCAHSQSTHLLNLRTVCMRYRACTRSRLMWTATSTRMLNSPLVLTTTTMAALSTLCTKANSLISVVLQLTCVPKQISKTSASVCNG